VATLESGWLSTGPRVAAFEQAFADYVGARYALAVNSCTAALHLSLIATGIGPGDEVITTPLTFCATANVVLHAGAWREGSKDENRRLLFDLARRGSVGVSPDYRLCPQSVFPAQVEDAKAAVRFLRANAASLKVDPERIGAMGFSAGGYLALMLGVTGPADGFEGDKASPGASRVQAVVDFFGPTDLADGKFSATAKEFVSCYLGGSGDGVKELASRASPVSYVGSGDPAVLVFQGTRDALVPPAQVFALMEKLTSAGVSRRVEFILGAEHGFQGPEYDRAMKETWEFLDGRLKNR